MKMLNIISIFAAAALVMSCSGNKSGESSAQDDGDTATAAIEFNADSAYSYVEKQCSFGPRVPETPAHEQCGAWIEQQLKGSCDDVIAQKAKLKTFDGKTLNATNYIGVINQKATQRVLLLAHWDCRPWADNDPDESKHKEPVMGANDAASGVGVLLELARQMKAKKPSVGVDIVLVDAEDWGTDGDDDSWALGTQYFVKHPHMPNYKPICGILLDMVGAQGAEFHREGFSIQYASSFVDQIWAMAERTGYGTKFLSSQIGMVTDDHVCVNEAGIPCVDIIDMRSGNNSGFFQYWHTTGDTMDKIDRNVLRAVGQTVANYIYEIQ